VSHGPNEFVPVRNLAACAAIYAQTAAEMVVWRRPQVLET
jgi:hypothetical protein